jgi:uncharacterized protein
LGTVQDAAAWLASLSLITDPWFYVVAVPCVLLMGVSKAGFGAGFGALVVPMMSLTVPVPQAAAIMLPLLLVMDAMGLKIFIRERDSSLLKLLLPAGLIGTVVGTLSFGVLSAKAVAGVVAATTLLFLAIRLFFPPKADAPLPPKWAGFGLGVVSGFTSFVAHAGGPPVSFYLLPQRLTPIVFTATSAVYFAAINASKWVPYAWLGLIDSRNLLTSAVLAPLAPIGVWASSKLTRRVKPTLFYALVHAGMFAAGVKLLWDGLH